MRGGFNSALDLRRLRERAKLSRDQLAAATGFTSDTVKYWEKHAGRVDGVAPEAFRKHLEHLGQIAPRRGEPPVPEQQLDPLPTKCGARTRKGGQCQCKPEPGKRRCKLHGGKSTGPKSAEGRLRIAAAQTSRWQALKQAPAVTSIMDVPGNLETEMVMPWQIPA